MTTVAPVETLSRERLYFRYLIEAGAIRRYGPFWQTPERLERIEMERAVIEKLDFPSYFIILARIFDFCRRENIPTGPGRGSVGGCYIAFLMGIHEADSIEHELIFERFLNEDRVSYPDVDMDFGQRDRDRVLAFIREEFERDGQFVLQVSAYARAGARSVVDTMLSALGQTDENAGATAHNLKRCFPDKGSISAGVKVDRELAWWIENGHGDREEFKKIAEQVGWLEPMLDIDGVFTHLAKHAAGVVILSAADMRTLPQTSTDGRHMMTGFDMYSLEDLGYLKLDVLGLRTLDIIADAHRFTGGSGSTDDLMALWREHRDDTEPYEILQEGDTVGIFQMETGGYRRTLRSFLPDCFEHLVQLGALYRPGALGYTREDGMNMVEVFIERRHSREIASFPHPSLRPILQQTHGIFLYQEQQMAAAVAMAGFSRKQADELRKAIGKKRKKEMDKLIPMWRDGCERNGIPDAVADAVWENFEAAARYAWNKSHAFFYGIITWLTMWFKFYHPAAFYAALLNSLDGDKEKMANVIAEARQRVELRPPDVNIAEDGFVVQDNAIVFGLNGLKGMGDSNRNAILIERMMGGPFSSYTDFDARVMIRGGDSDKVLPINLKKALIACGAFDLLGEDRTRLLATIPKPGKDPDKRWSVVDHMAHNRKLKTPRELPADISVYEFPSDVELAKGELDAMGYYISSVPLAALNEALARCPPGNTVGGEVESIRTKDQKNGGEMAFVTLTTPALTKQRVLMFASVWSVFRNRVEKGKQLLFRGRLDGDSFLADACWEPEDTRHFKKRKLTAPDGSVRTEDHDGELASIRALEAAGHRVRLL